VVEEHQAGAGGGYGRHNLIQLATADQRGGIGLGPALDEHSGDGCAGRAGQLLELCQRCVEVDVCGRRGRRRTLGQRFACIGTGTLQHRRCGTGLLRSWRQPSAVGGELDGHQHGKLAVGCLALSQQRLFPLVQQQVVVFVFHGGLMFHSRFSLSCHALRGE